MTGWGWLDLPLILLLVWQLFYGWRAGLVLSLCSVLGFAAGAVAAFFAVPLVSTWAGDSGWRLTAVVGSALLLLFLGYWLGYSVGQALNRNVRSEPIRVLNRALGAVAAVVITALLISPIAFTISSFGVAPISQAIGQSAVIRTIDQWTPAPVQQAVAQLRSTVLQGGIPQLLNPLGPITGQQPPAHQSPTPQLTQAGASVLRITGTAFQCGQNQTGSGFVTAPGRVVTNAHVVAGVSQPVVEFGGGALPGRVVYFNPQKDLAVIAVDGLNVAPLSLGPTLAAGAAAAVDGYPHGGPFQSKPATVTTMGTVMVPDIYGQNPQPEEIYQLAADVQPGNSGGPLLGMDGTVSGLVFAKSDSNDPVGYAFSLKEVTPVVQQAPGLSSQVSSGTCTKK
ncbi:MarP family serine protease [Psychromicrobium xiongbiense]|uniref:MarP family serine protease n=1 Tax=Psychromicrobium xiongbiense TaxID=3051184 RepID=UPI002556A18F|nr:MarP family serine protease [Psychromicrobium sp. YIM S02556]